MRLVSDEYEHCLDLQAPVTKGEAVKLLGIDETKIDYALPQPWVDEFVREVPIATHEKIVGGFVWSYEDESLLGVPRPLTTEAQWLLKFYDVRCGTHYVDDTITVIRYQQ